MGTSIGHSSYDWNLEHFVTLSDFEIGKFVVTLKEFYAYCEDTNTPLPKFSEEPYFRDEHIYRSRFVDYYNGKKFPGDEEPGLKPVTNITIAEAQEYCSWLSSKTGEEFRLPTEAEWEYAAKGGNLLAEFKKKHPFSFNTLFYKLFFKREKYSFLEYSGSNILDEVGWYKHDKSPNTWKTRENIGKKKPNQLGIYDMSGNVWEMCSDTYGKYSLEHQFNPTGSTAFRDNHVIRGGSVMSACSVTSRSCRRLGDISSHVGFRLVKVIR